MNKSAAKTLSNRKITLANRKDEIFAAYQELLAGVKSPSSSTEASQRAVSSADRIVKNLQELKSYIETASAEIANQKKQREEFKAEMDKLRKEWGEEQRAHRVKLEREDEEYRYQLEFERKKESDEFEAETVAKRASLKEREAEIAAMEEELTELRKRAESFPSELEAAVEAARNEAKAQAEKEAEIKHQIFSQKVEAEKKLLDQKITTLEEKVKSQAVEITSLRKVADEATRQVKDIAVKVIQGSGAPVAANQTLKSKTSE